MANTTWNRWVISCVAGMMMTAVSHGFVLDWDSVDWAGGATNQTFYNVDGSGMDVSISLAITGAAWAQWNDQAQPDDNRRLGGDGGSGQGELYDSFGNPSEESLHLHMDALARNYTGYVEVVISFSRAVTGLSFDLFDVDTGGNTQNSSTFEDVIADIGGSLNGVDVGTATADYDSDSIDRVVHPTRGDEYRGTYWAPDSEDVVLGLSWDEQVVDSVTFRYYAGNFSNTTPGTQGISISDISFASAVPEPGTVAGGALLLVGLVAGEWHRRRRANGSSVS
ncbi:MAG: hypothetical protein JW706_05085 [Opitutales bacterium]|nr:hypothetical protein [Opitutales bacterium]